MRFRDRQDAGRQLAKLLETYKGKNIVIFALPRGGVVLAREIAAALAAPLELVFAHKIGHPHHAEYAVAAVSESGHLVIGSPEEINIFGEAWLQNEKKRQMDEIRRKRNLYLKGKKDPPLEGKIVIIVDDGVATGLTLKAGILELKSHDPKEIVVAVPVTPKKTADEIKKMVDHFVALQIPDNGKFLGAVGAYYDEFSQMEDEEVIDLLL